MNSSLPKKERYANAANKHIDAVIRGLYRFAQAQDAIDKLHNIQQHFTVAAPRETNLPEHAVILWIKDYEITSEEASDGYMGNYALLRPAPLPEELHTISITKLPTELKYHPRRKRIAAAMPNWGHPLLRSIRKNTSYPTLDSAQAALQQLQLEYPQTTIPGDNKLYLMIFSREEDPKHPVQKYVIEIISQQGGGFLLECTKNADSPLAPPSANAAQHSLPMGHFTSMLALKKNKKRS